MIDKDTRDRRYQLPGDAESTTPNADTEGRSVPTWIAYVGWILISATITAVGFGVGVLAERSRAARRRQRDH